MPGVEGAVVFPAQVPIRLAEAGASFRFPSLTSHLSLAFFSRGMLHIHGLFVQTVQALVLFGNGLDRAGAQGIGSGRGRSPCRVRGNIDSLTI